jgi:hypothetical protein
MILGTGAGEKIVIYISTRTGMSRRVGPYALRGLY